MSWGSAFTSAWNKASNFVQQKVATPLTNAYHTVEKFISDQSKKVVDFAKQTPVGKLVTKAVESVKQNPQFQKTVAAAQQKWQQAKQSKDAFSKNPKGIFNKIKNKFSKDKKVKKPVQNCPLVNHKELCKLTSVEKPIAFIVSKMKKNLLLPEAASMKRDLNGLSHQMDAYILFYEFVKSGSVWDYKHQIKGDFGVWTCDKTNETNYNFDIWSNIHYGYIGLAVGFPEFILLSAAGGAQLKDGNSSKSSLIKSYIQLQMNDPHFLQTLDDPDDQIAIKIGFNLWKKFDSKITQQNVLDEIRKNSAKLKTKPCGYSQGKVLGASTNTLTPAEFLQPASQGVPAVIKPNYNLPIQPASPKSPVPTPKSQSVKSTNTPSKLSQLHPSVQKRAEVFLSKAKEAGFDLRITQGYRSIEEQDNLYAQGRTKPGSKVTNAKGGESFHNYGLAFDVVDAKKGYDIDWNAIGKIGREAGLEWGGDWTGFKDKPHFQYTGGLSLSQVQKGSRPKE